MNKKFFVPFNTARQLKEKGYPQKLATMYYDTFSGGEISLITDRECVSCVVDGNDRHPLYNRLSKLYIAAPTYHEVVDWLEEKGIYICIEVLLEKRGEFVFSSYIDWIGNINQETHVGTYPTREEALNAGILAALKKL